MRSIVSNIGRIVGLDERHAVRLSGEEMDRLDCADNMALLIEDGTIVAVDEEHRLLRDKRADIVTDARGGWLFPAFCDSHTHIVYAGSREGEFADKIRGLSYEEIARRGGGILNSSLRLRQTSEEELYRQAVPRIAAMMASGTATIEIKSGYGLNVQDELKMLRVIARLKESTPVDIHATLLGAHAVPEEYRRLPDGQQLYVDLICDSMIPAVAAEGLAEFVDVFCDKGFFTVAQTAQILETGAKYGLRPKIHANELAQSGGIETGVRYSALSVDHLEHTGRQQIAALLNSATMPTLLPGAAFFLGMNYAPARTMIDSGLGVALASDFNPGSSPSGNMKFILSLGCIKMKMSVREAINAATLNGAYAMGLHDRGTIGCGKRADFFIIPPLPSLEFLPYDYGTPMNCRLFTGGREIDIDSFSEAN